MCRRHSWCQRPALSALSLNFSQVNSADFSSMTEMSLKFTQHTYTLHITRYNNVHTSTHETNADRNSVNNPTPAQACVPRNCTWNTLRSPCATLTASRSEGSPSPQCTSHATSTCLRGGFHHLPSTDGQTETRGRAAAVPPFTTAPSFSLVLDDLGQT